MRAAPGTAPVTKGGRAPGAARRHRAGGRAGAGPAAPEGLLPFPRTETPGRKAQRQRTLAAAARGGCTRLAGVSRSGMRLEELKK